MPQQHLPRLKFFSREPGGETLSPITGQSTVSADLPVVTSPMVYPVELPASVEHLAGQAARLLGWGGTLLPPMTVLGRKVVIAAELITEVHAERIATGAQPVTDRISVATWQWPELAKYVPPPAVRIVGIIALSRHWRTALTAVASFSSAINTAIVVPASVSAAGTGFVVDCLMRANQHGIAVISAQERNAVQLELPGRTPLESVFVDDTTERWLNEVVYQSILLSSSEESLV